MYNPNYRQVERYPYAPLANQTHLDANTRREAMTVTYRPEHSRTKSRLAKETSEEDAKEGESPTTNLSSKILYTK